MLGNVSQWASPSHNPSLSTASDIAFDSGEFPAVPPPRVYSILGEEAGKTFQRISRPNRYLPQERNGFYKVSTIFVTSHAPGGLQTFSILDPHNRPF